MQQVCSQAAEGKAGGFSPDSIVERKHIMKK